MLDLRFALPSAAVRQRSPDGGGLSWSAEASALFARMSVQPDNLRKGVIDNLIVALKAAGVWAKLDALPITAAHSAQAAQLSWISSSYDLTETTGPSFTADRGFTGNGSSMFLDSGFNPTTAPGPKFTRDDACLFVWAGTDISSSTQFDVGNSSNAFIASRSSAAVRVRLNSPTNSAPTLPVNTGIGLTALSRSDNANQIVYKNGVNLGVFSAASAAPANATMTLLAGGGANFSARRVQAAGWGASLSEVEQAALYAALSTYMTSIGA